MRIFLDTEFTDLVSDNKLISIALVDEDENFFYAELTDTYESKDCSEFVKSYVLPFLKGGDYKMTYNECALKLGNWIEARNVKCMIASDNPTWDIPHLNKMLQVLWPENLETDMIFPVRISDEQIEKIVNRFNYDIHCALDDALVMKKVTLGY
jgi:hypothetical protein